MNKYTIWVRMSGETAVPVHYEMKVHYEIYIRDVSPPPKKNGKMWEFFPNGGPPPLPPVWE